MSVGTDRARLVSLFFRTKKSEIHWFLGLVVSSSGSFSLLICLFYRVHSYRSFLFAIFG